MGGAVAIRVDALREVVLVVPVVVLAALQRQSHARSLGVSTAVSTVVAFGVTWLTSSEYLGSIAGSLLPLVALGAAACLLGAVLLWGSRRGWSMPALVQAWLPRLLAGGFVLVGLVLASRPWWQVVRQSAADPGARVVAGLQARQGLTVDGGRTYAEHTLTWMSWWVGPIALGLALVATAVLAHRAASSWVDGRQLPGWSGPAIIAIGSTLLTLYRPGITPDHPWADRRLVIALPTVVVLTVACAAVVSRWSTRRLPYAVNVAVSVGIAAALLVPTALATRPHADERVELGEWKAVDTVCAALRPGDVALMVDSRAANEWPQVMRGLLRRQRALDDVLPAQRPHPPGRRGPPGPAGRRGPRWPGRAGRRRLARTDCSGSASRAPSSGWTRGSRRTTGCSSGVRTRWWSCRSGSTSAASAERSDFRHASWMNRSKSAYSPHGRADAA